MQNKVRKKIIYATRPHSLFGLWAGGIYNNEKKRVLILIILDYFYPKNEFKEYRTCKKEIKTNTDACIDNTLIFLISYPQYLYAGLILINDFPFKKKIFYNIPLFIFVIVAFAYCFYIMFYGDYFSKNMVYLREFPDDNFKDKEERVHYKHLMPFKYYIMIYSMINFIINIVFEKVLVKYLTNRWEKKQYLKNKGGIDTKEEKKSFIERIRNY